MANIFFISDLHLGHENIMKFGQRSFDTIDEHNEAIVSSWNAVVRAKDIVWVLGDICMDMKSMELFSRMGGRKRLILGNHDRFDIQVYLKYFESVSSFEKRYHGLVMTHIPVHPQEMAYRNWVTNVHGHIHHPEKDIQSPDYFNVNVDLIGMVPISLDQLRTKIELKKQLYKEASMDGSIT